MGVGCPEETTLVLANIIKCRLERLPIVYLGLPIGAKPRPKALWDPMIGNFKRKLSLWKKQYLSFCRRITLIKACLFNFPTILTYESMFL